MFSKIPTRQVCVSIQCLGMHSLRNIFSSIITISWASSQNSSITGFVDSVNEESCELNAKQENKGKQLHTAEDYTNRSRAFLALSRQIHQVNTDYNILGESLSRLEQENRWMNDSGFALSLRLPYAEQMAATQDALVDKFAALVREVKLVETYSNLYLERSKIGVSECFAMVTQRDSEVCPVSARSFEMCNRLTNLNRSIFRWLRNQRRWR